MRHISYTLILNIFFLMSCDTSIELTKGIENFDVAVEKNSYKVGEEVLFNLQGNVDMLTFYSGEVLSEYKYREGRIVELEDIILSFSTSKATSFRVQEDQLRVVISTDFNGDYSDFSHVEAATWTDISEHFTYSPNITFNPAGELNLGEYIEEEKPFYIGYRYIYRTSDHGNPTIWHVQAFNLRANSDIGLQLLGDLHNSGFQLIEEKPEVGSRSVINLAFPRITLRGYEQTPENDVATETWAISKPFDASAIDTGMDRPLAIKGVQDNSFDTYTYIYEEPGTYTATFVATNGNVDGMQRVVKEFQIVIEPE